MVRERIIEATLALIEQSGGDVRHITARTIAQQADVGLGLLNYYFGSKDQLITICVQRIIAKIAAGFQPDRSFETDRERLTACAAYVFHFLFENPAISRISILADLQNYAITSNSVYSQKRFTLSLQQDIADEDKAFFSFVLVAAMQTAFLGSGAVKELLGYDFTKEADRTAYIEKLVALLFEGGRKGATL